MDGKLPAAAAGLEGGNQRSAHAPALGIPVDVQPVQITGFGHIAEAHNFACQPGHQSIMGQEARPPALDAGAASPGSQLRRGIVPGADAVYGFGKQPD